MRFNGNLPIDQRSLMDLILSACEVRSIRRTTRSSLRVKLTSHGSKLESCWLEGCYQRHQHGAPFWALSLSWCGEPFILMFRSNPPTEGGGERKKLTRQNHHPQMGRPFCTSRRSRLSSGIIAVQRPLAPFSWRSLSYTRTRTRTNTFPDIPAAFVRRDLVSMGNFLLSTFNTKPAQVLNLPPHAFRRRRHPRRLRYTRQLEITRDAGTRGGGDICQRYYRLANERMRDTTPTQI